MGVAAALAATSAAMSAGGQLASGIGGRRAAKKQAQIAEINAFLAEQDAKAVIAQGGERAIQESRVGSARTAEAILDRVAKLGSGAVFGGGSETGFLTDLESQRLFAIDSVLADAENTSRSFLLEARSSRLQADINVQSANFQMAGSVVGGAAEFADVWRRYGTNSGGGGKWF